MTGSLRQKASRYRTFVHDETQVRVPTAPEPLPPAEDPTLLPDSPTGTIPAKGNKFKSKADVSAPRKLTNGLPAPAKNREPSPLTGVKIVYLDETMKAEYIQIAGYLMLHYRIRLTMTAYFCFLHEQAVTSQSDPGFLDALVQFTKRTTDTR
ncbi:hypothetical protein GGR92_004971 [Spirosoma lacussanchae]|uniref:hypothetical protein n=1 Tax=Spirosoma lacussanchae TaxID=1884249 RepID=UPI001FEBD116|nr:hypothetical protein [Spirosoma lacussanchae]